MSLSLLYRYYWHRAVYVIFFPPHFGWLSPIYFHTRKICGLKTTTRQPIAKKILNHLVLMTDVANTSDRRYTACRKVHNADIAITIPFSRHCHAPIETTQLERSDIRVILRHAVEQDVVKTATPLAIPCDQTVVSILYPVK